MIRINLLSAHEVRKEKNQQWFFKFIDQEHGVPDRRFPLAWDNSTRFFIVGQVHPMEIGSLTFIRRTSSPLRGITLSTTTLQSSIGRPSSNWTA